MKSFLRIVTLLLLFFSTSCAHHLKRTPASFFGDHYLQKYKEEAARYILSYKPQFYGKENKIIKDEEKLYQLLGQIDLNKMRNIPSRLTGHHNRYQRFFRLEGVTQISFEKWKELQEDVVAAYSKGDYVFRRGNDFYTLSGLKLSRKNIYWSVFVKAKNFIPNIDLEDLALSFFNRRTIYPVSLLNGESAALILPAVHIVRTPHLAYFMKDFHKQVGEDFPATWLDLLDFNYKAPPQKFGEYKIYKALKYQSFLNSEPMEDSNNACDTKFYFRTLSKRKEATIFMNTLMKNKPRLMDELHLSNNEYDELMLLALGILGVESKMGTSFKYKIKEDIRIGKLNFGQMAIRLLKRLKGRHDANSRGLTQIKDIGPLLEDTSYAYLEGADLDNPENAALATMFVLKEKLGYLRYFKKRHNNITKYNWADYLYYFYQGASSQITKGTATPPLNLRIQKILEIKDSTMIFTNCD